MRDDKATATKMRKSGASYREIYEKLRVPKATLSDWFSDLEWSRHIKSRLSAVAREVHTVRIKELNKIRGRQLQRVYDEARREADDEFRILKYNPLFIAGLMLYWGEGDKRSHSQVRLTNTDPEMMRLFAFFLHKACKIPTEKVRGSVIVYPDLVPATCISYWAKRTGITKKVFTKCPVIQGRHPFRKLSFGICMLVVSSTYFKVKILRWIELMPRELMSKAYYASM